MNKGRKYWFFIIFAWGQRHLFIYNNFYITNKKHKLKSTNLRLNVYLYDPLRKFIMGKTKYNIIY